MWDSRGVKRTKTRVLAGAIALWALSTGLSGGQTTVETIFYNAKIWTEDPGHKEAEAMAIGGERILAIGSSADVLKWKQPGTKVIDLDGKRVVPGFDDAHVHFYSGGSSLSGPQLRLAKSQAEFRNTLAEFTRQQPSGRWIRGGNWDHENWTPADLPTRQFIDAVTPQNPVFINRLDGHMSLANSLALKAAGIDKRTKDVAGGVIVRDAKGEPTGILKDAAQNLVERVIPAPSPEEMRIAIRAAQQYALSHGVTSVQDMSASASALRVYQSMLDEGELRVRISGHQPLASWRNLAQAGIQAGFGNPRLHIGGLKGFADGSLGSTTALFFEPYLDAPSTNGIPSDELSEPKRMMADIEGADAAGLQIAIHAIGDKANHTILNFYDRLEREHGVRDRRLRIEHAQHLLASDIPRFSALHVIASMQPYHAIDDGRWAEKRIGTERAKTTYAFRALLDAGAMLAFGSDWDVAPMDPVLGIYAAVTRRTLDGKHPSGWIAEQKISVAEAIHAYTVGSAYASFEEKIKGSLEAGKLADLVVLSRDILQIDAKEIPDTKVVATMVGGRIVSCADPCDANLGSGLKRDASGLWIRP